MLKMILCGFDVVVMDEFIVELVCGVFEVFMWGMVFWSVILVWVCIVEENN